MKKNIRNLGMAGMALLLVLGMVFVPSVQANAQEPEDGYSDAASEGTGPEDPTANGQDDEEGNAGEGEDGDQDLEPAEDEEELEEEAIEEEPVEEPVADGTAFSLEDDLLDGLEEDEEEEEIEVVDQQSLEEAIAAAASGDVIELEGSFNLASTVKLPSKTLVFEGNGHTIGAEASLVDEHFYTNNSGGDYTFNNMTIKGLNDGEAGQNLGARVYGGGLTFSSRNVVTMNGVTVTGIHTGTGTIYNITGTVTLNDCTFVGNSATRGGVYHHNNGKLIINGGEFVGNLADNGGVIHANYASDNKAGVYMNGATFKNNYAQYGSVMSDSNGSAGVQATDCKFINNESAISGGVMYLQGGANIFTGCEFNGNRSSALSGNGDWGGAALSLQGTNTIANCTFDDNVAYGKDGGAIFAMQGYLDISGSSFTNNSGRYGGAIYAYVEHITSMKDTTFANNTAEYGQVQTDFANPKDYYDGKGNVVFSQTKEAKHIADNYLNVSFATDAPCVVNNHDVYYNRHYVAYLFDKETVWSTGATTYDTQHNTFVNGGSFADNWAALGAEVTYEGKVLGGWRIRENYTPGYGTGVISLSVNDKEIKDMGYTLVDPASLQITGRLIVQAVWVSGPGSVQSYDVRYQPGTTETVTGMPSGTSVDEGDSFALPAAPKRAGYTFKGWKWNGSSYAAGASFTMPGEDVTFTAGWEKEKTTGESSSEKPTTPGGGQSSGSTSEAAGGGTGGSGGGTAAPQSSTAAAAAPVAVRVAGAPASSAPAASSTAPQPAAEEPAAEQEAAEPVVTGLEEDSTPTAGLVVEKEWSPLNLVLSIFMGCVAVAMALVLVVKRDREKLAWKVAAVAAGLVGFVLFWLTQGIGTQVVLFNGWTVVAVALLVVQTVSLVLARRTAGQEQEEAAE